MNKNTLNSKETIDYKRNLSELIQYCLEENMPQRFIDWVSKSYASINNNAEELSESLSIYEPVKHNECPNIKSVKLSDNTKPKNILEKCAVIKLNGGLGTSMGCNGPKSLIPIHNNKSFIDIILDQHSALCTKYNVDIPLIFMNSFNTDPAMRNIDVNSFLQNKVPRLNKKDLKVFKMDGKPSWNPPGHGDIYLSLYESGILDELIKSNIEVVFISNSDNLGATLETSILQYFMDQRLDFLMEVTPKTKLDVKGGAIVKRNNTYALLERAQVRPDEIGLFEDINTFSYFNTNNLWVRLSEIKSRIENNQLDLPLIVNGKIIDGTEIIQFETAMGAGLSIFDHSECLHVERDRFLPVKKTSDLLLLQSDIVSKNSLGKVTWNTSSVPTINISDDYTTVDQFETYFSTIPSIKELKSLTLKGKVTFGKNVTLKGNVTIINNDDSCKYIHDVTYEDQEVLL